MKERLHVLLVPSYYPAPESPATGLFMRDLARAISTLNEVTVLAPASAASAPDEVIDGIRTLRIPQLRGWSRLQKLHRVVWLWRSVSRLRREGSAVDVIHAHYFLTGSSAVIVGSARGLPVVVTENLSAHTTGGLSASEVRLARFTYKRAARVFPDSPLMEDRLRLLEPRGRYEVVPEVVDIDAFAEFRRQPRDGPNARILAVSNLIRRKGLDHLIEAVRLLVTDGRDVSLTVVGEGPERGALEAQAKGMPVELVGARSRAEIAKFLQHADVFAMPTLGDPFGIAPVEALAAGVPVVITDAAGSADLLGPLGARVVRPGDPPSLRDAIVECLQNPNSIAPEAAAVLRRYCGLEAVGERLNAIYRSLPRMDVALAAGADVGRGVG
jgi:glycosyltransferase involved in cell wall biosynthesis